MKTNPHDPATGIRVDEHVTALGLTKREHFAGLAMHGLLVKYGNADKEWIALLSVVHADALIKQLNEE